MSRLSSASAVSARLRRRHSASGHESENSRGGHRVRTRLSAQLRAPRMDIEFEKPHVCGGCRFQPSMSYSQIQCRADVINDMKARLRLTLISGVLFSTSG